MIVRKWRPQAKTRKLLDCIANVLSQYDTSITLRQLYYRLVTQGVILNNEKQYKRLGRIVKDARYAGRILWDAI